MVKKLVSHGNSSALIIDKAILELLNITSETSLEISTDGENLLISPIKDKKRISRLEKSLGKINKKYGKTLKKLAE